MINTRKSVTKYLATLIEILGRELNELNTIFLESIKNEIDSVIEDRNFFSENRRLRNNIHYAEINEMSIDKFNMIEFNQKKYFETLIRNLNTFIQIDIDTECLNMTRYLRGLR